MMKTRSTSLNKIMMTMMTAITMMMLMMMMMKMMARIAKTIPTTATGNREYLDFLWGDGQNRCQLRATYPAPHTSMFIVAIVMSKLSKT